MSVSIEKNDGKKGLALFLFLFLAYIYKEMVWDPYFEQDLKHKNQVARLDQVDNNQQVLPSSTTENNIVAPRTTAPVAPAKNANVVSDQQIKSAGELVFETAKIRANISVMGGRVTELLLKEYNSSFGSETKLNMVDHVEFAEYPFAVYSGNLSDEAVSYQVVSKQDDLLVLEGNFSDGRKITKTFKFNPDSYFIDLVAKFDKAPVDLARASVEWTKQIPKNSPTLLDPYNKSGYIWFNGQKVERADFASLKSDLVNLDNADWVSMADKYFMVTLLSKQGTTSAKVLRTDDLYRLRLYGTDSEVRLSAYVGPKNYQDLIKAGSGLERNIDFGKTAVIAVPLLNVLHILYNFFGNYGLAIVMLTILVKFALYPLTASSFRQMKAMQDLAPEMQKIKESGKDKQQQQAEIMQMYKTKGVNPLGGCLPMFLQLPIFLALFSVLSLDIELRHAKYALWIHDLSAPDRLIISGHSIPVMVIIFVITMLIQQWTTPSTMDPAQKKAMLVMPVVFGFMFAGMPAGLTLYYLTNNFISIAQQRGLKSASKGSGLKLMVGVTLLVFIVAFALTKIG